MRRPLFSVLAMCIAVIGVSANHPYSLDIINLFSSSPIHAPPVELSTSSFGDYGKRFPIRETVKLPEPVAEVDLAIECSEGSLSSHPMLVYLDHQEIPFSLESSPLKVFYERELMLAQLIELSVELPEVTITFESDWNASNLYQLEEESYPDFAIGSFNWTRDILSSYQFYRDQQLTSSIFHQEFELDSPLGGYVQSSSRQFQSVHLDELQNHLVEALEPDAPRMLEMLSLERALEKSSIPFASQLRPPVIKHRFSIPIQKDEAFALDQLLMSMEFTEPKGVGSAYWSQDILGRFIEGRDALKIQELLSGSDLSDSIRSALAETLVGGMEREYQYSLDQELLALRPMPKSIPLTKETSLAYSTPIETPRAALLPQLDGSRRISSHLSTLPMNPFSLDIGAVQHELHLEYVAVESQDFVEINEVHVDTSVTVEGCVFAHQTLSPAFEMERDFSVLDLYGKQLVLENPKSLSPDLKNLDYPRSRGSLAIHYLSSPSLNDYERPVMQASFFSLPRRTDWVSHPMTKGNWSDTWGYALLPNQVDLVYYCQQPSFMIPINIMAENWMAQAGYQEVSIGTLEKSPWLGESFVKLVSEEAEARLPLGIPRLDHSGDVLTSVSSLPASYRDPSCEKLFVSMKFQTSKFGSLDALLSEQVTSTLYELPLKSAVDLPHLDLVSIHYDAVITASQQPVVFKMSDIHLQQASIDVALMERSQDTLAFLLDGASDHYFQRFGSMATLDIGFVQGKESIEMIFGEDYAFCDDVLCQRMRPLHATYSYANLRESYSSENPAKSMLTLDPEVQLASFTLPTFRWGGANLFSPKNRDVDLLRLDTYARSEGLRMASLDTNRQNRVTHLLLAQMPSLADLDTDTLSDEFQAQVKVAPRMRGEGYVFSVRLKPHDREFISPERQTIYYLIDQGSTVEPHRFDAYKAGVLQSLQYLPSDCQFNIILFGQQIQMLNPEGDLNPTKSAKRFAQKFLKRASQTRISSCESLINTLEMIKERSAQSNEMSTCILLSDGKLMKNVRINRQSMMQVLAARPDTFALYTMPISDNNNLSMMELLARIGRGEMIYTKTHMSFPRRLSQFVKRISRPVAHGLYVTQVNKEDESVQLEHLNDFTQQLFLDRSFNLYGTANNLKTIDLLIQGEREGRYITIRKQVSLNQNVRGKASLEKEYCSRKALSDIVEFIVSNDQTNLIRAKEALAPFDHTIASR